MAKTLKPKPVGDGSIDPNYLQGLAREIDSAKQRQSDAGTEVASIYKEAKDNRGVHTGALKHVMKLYRMEPDKREEYIRARDAYEQILIERQSDIFLDQPKGDDEDVRPRHLRPVETGGTKQD